MPSRLKPEIIRIDPRHPEPALIAAAVALLRAGGVIAYPTETFYGLGADAGNAAAVERLFAIKGRPADNPIALIADEGAEAISRFAANIPPAARRLMQAFWPGPLTLLFPALPSVLPVLTAGTGRIGIRVSSHPIAAALAKALGSPLTATSANLAGEKACLMAAQVCESLGEKLDAVLDAVLDGGPAGGGEASTLLDVTVEPPVVVRAGAVPTERIYAVLNKRV